METAEQRDQRIARLEAGRLARASGRPAFHSDSEGPTEVAPGRGDLNYSSVPVGPSSSILQPWIPAVNTGLFTVEGKQISYAKVFSQQTWVAAAVMRMLTWAVRVPLKAYERTGEDSRRRLRPDDHPVAAAIQTPRPGAYPARLTMELLGPFLVHGNSTNEVDEGANGDIMFVPHDWRTTQPVKLTPTSPIDGWAIYDEMGQAKRRVSADLMAHAAWWSPLGPEGISPLQQLGTTLRIEDAAQRYQVAQFRNGARPPSAIEASVEFLGLEPTVRDQLLEQLREDVTALYSGPENGGRPALLPPGLVWKPIGHTSVEAELIEQRYISREEIAAVLQIPPPSLGDLRRATYSNITELRQVAYSDGLGPPLVVIEQVLTAIFQSLLRDPNFYLEFDFSGVLRGDLLKEVNALRLAIGMGMMTPNEARAIQNRKRAEEPEADQLWMPWNNLAPMGSAPEQNGAATKARNGGQQAPENARARRTQRRTEARELVEITEEGVKGNATAAIPTKVRERPLEDFPEGERDAVAQLRRDIKTFEEVA